MIIGTTIHNYELSSRFMDQANQHQPHKRMNSSMKVNGMTFGQAIEAMKKGKKVTRAGWNGKGMFLYHVPANSYPAQRNLAGSPLRGVFQDDMVPYGAYIAMKTAQDNVIPWLASQTDMLAEDWEVVE